MVLSALRKTSGTQRLGVVEGVRNQDYKESFAFLLWHRN